MKDNELVSITHQIRELETGKNKRMTTSILIILQVSEREIQKQVEQQMQMGNDPLQTELFDQTVWLMKNCDDTRADIKEEYQKELTVFAQRSGYPTTRVRGQPEAGPVRGRDGKRYRRVRDQKDRTFTERQGHR
jgi:hypothetical protein